MKNLLLRIHWQLHDITFTIRKTPNFKAMIGDNINDEYIFKKISFFLISNVTIRKIKYFLHKRMLLYLRSNI